MPEPTSTALGAVGVTVGAPLDELVRSAGPRRRAASDAAIVLEDLVKTYPDGTKAVNGLSLRIAAGEAYGLLGPNGAGKSTTIGVLGTLVRPTGGRALVAGYDVVAHSMQVRRRIGFAMQQTGVDEFATARELMILQGRLQGLAKHAAGARAGLLLRLMELEPVADKRVATLSGGTKRRVDLAASLMHLPPILFLDEPTAGLDPRSRAAFWDTLEHLRGRLAITVVLTTHDMEEGDRLCDRIGVIDRGALVTEGTSAELKAAVARHHPHASVTSPTLEDVYLHYTGRSFDVTTGDDDEQLGRAA
jgi:ABC-2 type transport system ATP-binding protein